MKFFPLFTLLLLPVSEEQPETLSDYERNLMCCAQKADCCKTYPTDFEVKAILVKCHKPGKRDENKKMPTTVVRKIRNTKDEEDCSRMRMTPKTGIVNCKKKLKVTIRVKNTGITNTKCQYILIDHVFDSVTQQSQKLFNPYVLKIIQQPVLAVYGLCYDGIVNSQATEEVFNKDQAGYTGCNLKNNPTCASSNFKGNDNIPYSNGFCCSCDRDQSQHYRNISEIPFENKFSKSSKFHYNMNGKDVSIENSIPVSLPMNNELYSKRVNEKGTLTNKSRSIRTNRFQKRGGQDCSDKYTPPNVNPEAYHSSTHCLLFSDLWYFVYRLQKPQLTHSVYLQLYEKYQSLDGCKWREITKKRPIILGTDLENYINEESTLSMEYTKKDVTDNLYTLNHLLHKLLVPDAASVEDKLAHPELRGGPSEYLVIKNTQIQTNGKTCNVAGVGYEAFVKQPNRCVAHRGACLRNQPVHMWQQDHELEMFGKKGNYFLKYYGLLPDNPMAFQEENKSLAMYFTNTYHSILDLEIKADDNPLVRANSLAIITEVYIESTSLQKTSIIAKVFNSGLIPSVFYVGLTDCPFSLPASFSHINSKPALIPPQQHHIYNLEIQCPLPLSSFVCSLNVLNMKQELIAIRKIRLQETDRCICIWHCSCSCYNADFGLVCKPVSLEAYHMAGFQGGLPVPLQVVEYTLLDDIIAIVLYVFLTLCLTLLAMGLLKGLIGLCVVPIGLWGLDIVLDLPKKIKKYYENDIRHRPVIYDENGWPVHPETTERVRNIPVHAEFCINVIFFIIYPFCLFWYLVKKACFHQVDQNEIELCYCKQGTAVQRKDLSLQSSLLKKSKKDG